MIDFNSIPKKPGIYIWKGGNDNYLYVGKAKDLNSRMKQYFNGNINSFMTQNLVSQIKDYEYIITKNNKEAMVLERNLIEKYSPEFNIKLQDSKRYPYILVELNKKVNVKLVYRIRSHRQKNNKFFGPFPTGYGAKTIKDFLEKMSMYENGLPIKQKSFIWHEAKYNEIVELLSGNEKSLVNVLKEKMLKAANNLQFELAHDYKNVVNALDSLNETQDVEINSNKNIDVIAFVENGEHLFISLLFYRFGALLSKKDNVVKIINTKQETIDSYINQYYWNNLKPSLLITNEKINTDIDVINPLKGAYKKILDIAYVNSKDNMVLKLEKYNRNIELTLGATNKLKKLLGLKKLNHILMIDNSNTNNTDPVSAIVSYRNGVPVKSEYRRYKLISNNRNADVEYMRQGTWRYFEKNKIAPDLFIVDGGIAQVNEVKKIKPDLNIIGLVKNEKHITSHIINSKGNKIIVNDQILLNFLKGIQFEVDRFAKFAHTKIRSIKTLEGKLTSIEGVAIKTESKLLEHFKTYSNIYNAPIEELEKVVSQKVAKNIRNFFLNS